MVVKSSAPVSRAVSGNFSSLQAHGPYINNPSQPFHIPRELPLPARVGGKSHARKQDLPHIPKNRNPFLLFRAYFLEHNPLPRNIPYCADQAQLSRICSRLWNLLSDEDREVFYDLGEEEKKQHAAKYPSFKYNPRVKGTTRVPPRQSEDESMMATQDIAASRVARALHEGIHGEALADKVQEIVLELGLSNPAHQESATPRASAAKSRSSSRNITSSPYPSIGKRSSPRRGETKSTSSTVELDAGIAVSEYTEEPVSPPPSSPSSVGYTFIEISPDSSLPPMSRGTSPVHTTKIRGFSPFNALDDTATRSFDDAGYLDFEFNHNMEDEPESTEYDAFYWEEQATQTLLRQNAFLELRGRTPFDPDFLTKTENSASLGSERWY